MQFEIQKRGVTSKASDSSLLYFWLKQLLLFSLPFNVLYSLLLIKTNRACCCFIRELSSWVVGSGLTGFLIVRDFNHLICTSGHWYLSGRGWYGKWAGFRGGPGIMWWRHPIFLHLLLSLHLL